MKLSTQTQKYIEMMKADPDIIKNEIIIDGITGLYVFSINSDVRNSSQSVFGITNAIPKAGEKTTMGYLLTESRIIVYYIDTEKNLQWRTYPLNEIENITFDIVGWINKSKTVRIFMKGVRLTVQVTSAESPESFVETAKKYLEPQGSNQSNFNELTEDNFFYCMKCGQKLPIEAVFCMKCGEKLKS